MPSPSVSATADTTGTGMHDPTTHATPSPQSPCDRLQRLASQNAPALHWTSVVHAHSPLVHVPDGPQSALVAQTAVATHRPEPTKTPVPVPPFVASCNGDSASGSTTSSVVAGSMAPSVSTCSTRTL